MCSCICLVSFSNHRLYALWGNEKMVFAKLPSIVLQFRELTYCIHWSELLVFLINFSFNFPCKLWWSEDCRIGILHFLNIELPESSIFYILPISQITHYVKQLMFNFMKIASFHGHQWWDQTVVLAWGMIGQHTCTWSNSHNSPLDSTT